MDTKNNNKKLPLKTTNLPTRKQLERIITQSFREFYRQRLGCNLQKASCTLFCNYLVIVAEEGITPIEKTIKELGQIETLLEIRQSINRVLKPQLKEIIQEIVVVEINDIICHLNFDSGRLMAIAVFNESPKIRSKKSKVKTRQPTATSFSKDLAGDKFELKSD